MVETEENVIGPTPICLECKHYRGITPPNGLTCGAFPEGIPKAILVSQHDHHEPFAGDNGVLFEPSEATTEAR